MGLGPMALGLMGLDGGAREDRHVADALGPPDLDQRLPTLEAGGSKTGRELSTIVARVCARHSISQKSA